VLFITIDYLNIIIGDRALISLILETLAL